jgi:hypothetical protein
MDKKLGYEMLDVLINKIQEESYLFEYEPSEISKLFTESKKELISNIEESNNRLVNRIGNKLNFEENSLFRTIRKSLSEKK